MFQIKRPRFRLSFRLPKAIRIPFFICYALTLFQILLVLTVVLTIQPVVPLFYSLASPEQQLAPREWLLLFPLVSSLISVGHTITSQHIQALDPVLGRFFAWSTVVIQVILTLSLIRIIWIVS